MKKQKPKYHLDGKRIYLPKSEKEIKVKVTEISDEDIQRILFQIGTNNMANF